MATKRAKMPVAERAKQFMPFSALKGFHEALIEKEKITIPKAEIAEDQAEIIERRLSTLKPMDQVSVIYYHGGEYVRVIGYVMKIDAGERLLTVAGNAIPIGDIYNLTIEKRGDDDTFLDEP